MRRALWLPAHPAVGATSMDRYWRELDRARQRQVSKNAAWELKSALGDPPANSRTLGRLQRAWQKYVAYPLRVRITSRLGPPEIAHVLDHSFSHLLTSLPREGTRRIVTVHDLAPLRDPTGLTKAQQDRFRRTVTHARTADLLLADSSYSAAEAGELLDIPAEKIRVLPLGVDVGGFSRAVPGDGAAEFASLGGRKVLLSVGASVSRKNLELLPAILEQTGVERLTLLRVGDFLSPALADSVREVLGTGGLLELGRVSETMLVAAYRRADALILPSRIEGFGFPVLEAMAAGCPVVTTNVTSLPEVGGEAALYFAPDDPTAAAIHLRRLLMDEAFRERVIAAGRERVAEFSWQRHFERLLAIYDEVAGARQ